jgi:oligopeptide/dipeptide ABC transporter ATP-binding protein
LRPPSGALSRPASRGEEAVVHDEPELTGDLGMVASTHWLASQAGMSLLEAGGNVFDAAVAAGFVLQVVEPHLNGPGGEAPMLVQPACAAEPTVIAGRIVEHASVHELYAKPCHPYTMALLESIPRLEEKGESLRTIEGLPPNLAKIPPGCPFHPRCPMARDICRSEVPELVQLGGSRTSACHFAEELSGRE